MIAFLTIKGDFDIFDYSTLLVESSDDAELGLTARVSQPENCADRIA
jgi:hypothetical protein